MTEALEDTGFKVDTVQNGVDVEHAVSRQNFALVIADIDTPAFVALDFLNSIKTGNPATEIIIVSKRPLVEDAVALMKHGAFDFIVKPVSMEQVILTARHLFEKRIKQKHTASRTDLPKTKSSNRNKDIEIITCDKAMQRLLNLAKRVAGSTASVLIQGESGTGKELFARFIHENSKRKHMPFVALNCAALPENLLESELFGHEKGAFTGAVARKEGKFEIAHQGTLFLDEITEMQYHLQAKLLRVLQEKIVDRLGGTEPLEVDVRIIATTNRYIKESIKNGTFREDLYYRLNTIPLLIPPLRDRIGDLKLLCDYFLQKYTIIDARDVKGMTPEVFQLLSCQKFSGNVRELENIIHRAVLLAQDEFITLEDLMMEDFDPLTSTEDGQLLPAHGSPLPVHGPPLPDHGSFSNNSSTGFSSQTSSLTKNLSEPEALNAASLSGEQVLSGDIKEGLSYNMPPASLKEMEEHMIYQTLDKTRGNRTHAAKILGISVRTLRNKLNEYKEKKG